MSRTRRARYRWITQGCWRFGENIIRNCSNEEFMWRRDDLETLAPTEGPCEQFTVEEVRNTIHEGPCE